MGCNISAILISFGQAKAYMVAKDIKKDVIAKMKARSVSKGRLSGQEGNNGIMLNIRGRANTNYVFIVGVEKEG